MTTLNIFKPGEKIKVAQAGGRPDGRVRAEILRLGAIVLGYQSPAGTACAAKTEGAKSVGLSRVQIAKMVCKNVPGAHTKPNNVTWYEGQIRLAKDMAPDDPRFDTASMKEYRGLAWPDLRLQAEQEVDEKLLKAEQ